MTTFFLTAKKIALDEQSKQLDIEHLKKAVDAVEFVDTSAKEIVCEYLHITQNLKQLYTIQDIEAVKRQKTLPFSDDVASFKRHLEENGFALNIVATKVFIEKNNVLASFKENINALETSLQSQIFGQEEAIEAVCDKIVEASYNVSKNNGPRGIFFFLGPPATGKTMLAQIMGQELEGYNGFKVFDMTQYVDEEAGLGLFGSESVYKNSGEGRLTKYVKEHPQSVIVFDEIEKTHPSVLSNFLMLLSNGKAEDTYSGEMVDFSQTILIFTSNLGSELYNNQKFVNTMKNNPQEASSIILETIGREEKLVNGHMVKALSPEILSRLSQGQIILFNKLSFSTLLNIAKKKVLEIESNFINEFGLQIEYKNFDKIITTLLLSLAPLIDIRKLKAKLPLMLFDLITDYIRRSDFVMKKIVFSIDKESEKFLHEELLNLSEELQTQFLHTLFRKNETFSYEIRTKKENEILEFEFFNIAHKKLARSSDYSGEDGLVFEVPTIKFDEIAGHKVAKKRLSEVINILKDPKKLDRFDLTLPKGMLLYGVPGTGKTMLAKAFAHEADLPFLQTTGSEILNLDLMKKIFKKAREYAPSIIFIDEIDAIGTRNGGFVDILINQLLTEINGFSDNIEEQVFIIAATNLKEKIDPAILRSGRIDIHIEIDTLDREARAFFIEKILQKPTEGEFNKEKLLTYTAGMTGADLEKVARESSLYLFRNSLDALTQEIVVEQINTIKYGKRITDKSIEKLLESTAIHEAGHAILSRILMPEVRIEQITVVPRANALGFVSYDQEKNYSNLTRQNIKNKLCVAFAGREAQLKQYGEEGFDSGASSDLEMATRYALYAIKTLGMGESTGYINLDFLNETNLFEQEVQAELKVWLDEAQKRTQKLITEHWNKVKTLAILLEEKEIVNETELLEIINTK